jgi:site-specific DNA recombinase
MVDQEIFELAQAKLDQNKQMARRNNTSHDYLLRGLVSCAQCRLACTGRMVHPGYSYYVCRGRTEALRIAKDLRCTARYAPTQLLDDLVWQDLCQLLTTPTMITHELQRAQAGEWLPQALQSRRHSLQQAVAQVERQQTRLLEAYLAEVITIDEFERKRRETAKTYDGLSHQLRQLDAQAQKHINLAVVAAGIEDFCQRIQPTLQSLSFSQRRQLVELLIDRVIVNDDQVEIRYAVPTGPEGEQVPFCHLRKDHFDRPTMLVTTPQVISRHVGANPTEPQRLRWVITLQMRLDAQHGKDRVSIFPGVQVRPEADLDAAPFGVIQLQALVRRMPGIRFLEGKALAMHPWPAAA